MTALFRSCFYRSVPMAIDGGKPLIFLETEKTFDPISIYGDSPNSTHL